MVGLFKVDTEQGIVRLSGVARSLEEAERAVAIAKSVSGVAAVKDDMEIEGR